MKSIILPAILLICTLFSIVWAHKTVNNTIDDLIDQTEALPNHPTDDALQAIEGLEEHWNKHSELYSTVIKFDFVYNFTKELAAAKAGAASSDQATYLAAKNSMINILEYIKDVQQLRIDNVL